MKLQEFLDKARAFGAKVKALREKSPKVFDLTVTVVVTLVLVGACTATRAAPLTCDLTGSVLTCNVPNSGTTVPVPGTPPKVDPVPAGCQVIKATQGTKIQFPNTFAVEIKVADTRTVKATASPDGGGGTWDFAISAKPCDFDSPVPLVSTTTGNVVQGSFAVIRGSNGFAVIAYKGGSNVVVGQTYYFNIRGQTGGLVLK